MFKKIALSGMFLTSACGWYNVISAHEIDRTLKVDIAVDYDKNLKALFTHFHQTRKLFSTI